MLRKRRAVGEIIAALMLMFIASMAGVILFTTSIKASNEQGVILRDQYKNEGDSAQERFEILYAEYDESKGTISVWFYNYGKLECDIIGIYVDEKPIINQNPENIILKTNEITKITITPENVPGNSYKIICISGRGVKNESNWTI